MESISFDMLLKSYLEVGVLGIIAIVFILIAVYLVKKMRKDFNWFQRKVDDGDMVLNTTYEKFLENQQKQNEYLIKQIVDQVTQHTPSPEENRKLTEIQNKIDDLLKQILIETNASRVCLIQYHNGGRGVNKQSFLKMSCTNEQMQIGEKPFITLFQNQFRSVLSYVVNTLDKQDTCYIEDIEKVKNKDYGTYDFLQTREIKHIYCRALHGEEHMIIGFIMVSYNIHNKNNGSADKVDRELKDIIHSVETLLSIHIND